MSERIMCPISRLEKYIECYNKGDYTLLGNEYLGLFKCLDKDSDEEVKRNYPIYEQMVASINIHFVDLTFA